MGFPRFGALVGMAAIAVAPSPSLRAEGPAAEPAVESAGIVLAASPPENMPARVATGPAMPSCLISEGQGGRLDFQVSFASAGGGGTGAPSGRCAALDRAAPPRRTRYRAVPFAPDPAGRPVRLCPNRPTGDAGAPSESPDLRVVGLYRERPNAKRYDEPKDLGNATSAPTAELDGYVSPEQDMLVFASDRPGGYGRLDLYVRHRVVGGWSPARNLGRGVNGPDDELCPQLTRDGRLLVFSRSEGLFQVDSAVLDDATP